MGTELTTNPDQTEHWERRRLQALRRELRALRLLVADLRDFGFDAPEAIAKEMETLEHKHVVVHIPCLLCGQPQATPWPVADDGMPYKTLCEACDAVTTATAAAAE